MKLEGIPRIPGFRGFYYQRRVVYPSGIPLVFNRSFGLLNPGPPKVGCLPAASGAQGPGPWGPIPRAPGPWTPEAAGRQPTFGGV